MTCSIGRFIPSLNKFACTSFRIEKKKGFHLHPQFFGEHPKQLEHQGGRRLSDRDRVPAHRARQRSLDPPIDAFSVETMLALQLANLRIAQRLQTDRARLGALGLRLRKGNFHVHLRLHPEQEEDVPDQFPAVHVPLVCQLVPQRFDFPSQPSNVGLLVGDVGWHQSVHSGLFEGVDFFFCRFQQNTFCAMASLRNSNPDYSSTIVNQFSSKAGYRYETAPPAPYPSLYDDDDDDDEELLKVLRQLLAWLNAQSKTSTGLQKVSPVQKLLQLAKKAGVTITPALQAKALKLLAQGNSPEEIVTQLKPKKKAKKPRPRPTQAPTSRPPGTQPKPTGPMYRKLRQYDKQRGKVQTWSQERVKVPKRPVKAAAATAAAATAAPASSGLKAKVLAKAKELGPPFQQQIEDAVNSGVPLQTIIGMIPGGVGEKKTKVMDTSITKEEVYRKAFFLPPSKKKLVHDALKKGTKPSLVASQIPDQFDVPLKPFVLGTAIAAMTLSVMLA